MSRRDENLDDTPFENCKVRVAELNPISSTLFNMEPNWDVCDDDVEIQVEYLPVWDKHEEVIDNLIPQLGRTL